MSEKTEFLKKRFNYWYPVLFRGTLWVGIELLRETVSNLLSWKHQLDVSHIPITELDVWIFIAKVLLAGVIGCRLFLDQSYSRHLADNPPEVIKQPALTEEEYLKKQTQINK